MRNKSDISVFFRYGVTDVVILEGNAESLADRLHSVSTACLQYLSCGHLSSLEDLLEYDLILR